MPGVLTHACGTPAGIRPQARPRRNATQGRARNRSVTSGPARSPWSVQRTNRPHERADVPVPVANLGRALGGSRRSNAGTQPWLAATEGRPHRRLGPRRVGAMRRGAARGSRLGLHSHMASASEHTVWRRRRTCVSGAVDIASWERVGVERPCLRSDTLARLRLSVAGLAERAEFVRRGGALTRPEV